MIQGESRSQESTELRAAINAGKACVVQLMNYRKNGDPFVNYLSITPILDAQGRLTHYVGIQSDITELVNHKKAELAARHAALQVCWCAIHFDFCTPGSSMLLALLIARASPTHYLVCGILICSCGNQPS